MYSSQLSALVIVDLQVDFCPGGSLAVSGGDEIVAGLNNLVNAQDKLFKKIVLTADWHPKSHVSFASTHNLDPFSIMQQNGTDITLWPDHCIEGTPGAEFHSDLRVNRADLIIRKGRDPRMDSYSAFYENDRITPTGLKGYLENHGITQVFLCGLAFDWCVYFSAMDSLKHGFETYVIMDLTRAIDLPDGYALEKEKEMQASGITIIKSSYFKADR